MGWFNPQEICPSCSDNLSLSRDKMTAALPLSPEHSRSGLSLVSRTDCV